MVTFLLLPAVLPQEHCVGPQGRQGWQGRGRDGGAEAGDQVRTSSRIRWLHVLLPPLYSF